jgi:hypothetical protein
MTIGLVLIGDYDDRLTEWPLPSAHAGRRSPTSKEIVMIRSVIAAAVLFAAAAPAFAVEEAQERAAAIGACRAAVAEKAGVEATTAAVDFRRSETKSREFKVRFIVRDGETALGGAECVYQRRQAAVATVSLDEALMVRTTTTAAR